MERETKTYVLKRSIDEAVPRTLSIDYAAALNSQQLAAVTAGEGPSLVIAGAGSGKTRTLVYRVAYLIDSGIDPSQILLLTFTRKSSQEMLDRAGELIGVRSERVRGGTFHSAKRKGVGNIFCMLVVTSGANKDSRPLIIPQEIDEQTAREIPGAGCTWCQVSSLSQPKLSDCNTPRRSNACIAHVRLGYGACLSTLQSS